MNKLIDIQLLLSSQSPQVLLISETWLHQDISNNELNMAGYHIVSRKDRQDTKKGRGGGTAILCKDDLNCSSLYTDHPDVCGIRVDTIDIFCVYLSPGANTQERLDLNTFLSSLHKDSLVVGDFNYPNIDWSTRVGSSSLDSDFVYALDGGFLEQMVMKPIHAGGNLLDLVLTNERGYIKYGENLWNLRVSDHCLLEVG